MYPEPGPVRAVDQRITRYSFSPMRLKIHSAVRVWFAISRQVTRDTWVTCISLRCANWVAAHWAGHQERLPPTSGHARVRSTGRYRDAKGGCHRLYAGRDAQLDLR